MTYQQILDEYLEKRVNEDDIGVGTFEWEDESEEDFPYDWQELRAEFIAEHREEYLAELISEHEAEPYPDDEDDEASADEYDPKDDYDEDGLLDRYDFDGWISDKTGWSPEELDAGGRGILYELSATYATDDDGFISDISDITKRILRSEDARSLTFDDIEPNSDDYDRLSELLEEILSDEACDEDDASGWDAYEGYPFAAEVVNGEIISMTDTFQQEVLAKLLSAMAVTKDELAAFLSQLNDGEESDDERFTLLADCEHDFLAELLGYDADEEAFSPAGIGFLESSYGFEAIDLLKQLGFTVEENIQYGSHGHGTDGVCYVE